MKSIVALSFLAFAGFSAAQDAEQNNYPYTIDPDSVSPSDRQTWCDNQKAQCPLICLQEPGVTSMTTVSNDCDEDALTYSCVCENNVAPNITQYSQTLPFYICQEWGNQCADNCGNDNVCASACREDHPCGAQDTKPPNSSVLATMSATASQTGKASIPVTGFGGAAATGNANNDQGAAPATLNLGYSYGMAVLFAGVFGGFAVFL